MRWNTMHLTIAVAGVICLGMTLPVFAKREAPKPVKPVLLNGIEYRIVHEQFEKNGSPAGMRAFVVAQGQAIGKELWKAQLYELTYDLNLETDIQDVYVISLVATDDGLHATTEKSREFVIDVKQHTVREIGEKRLPE